MTFKGNADINVHACKVGWGVPAYEEFTKDSAHAQTLIIVRISIASDPSIDGSEVLLRI